MSELTPAAQERVDAYLQRMRNVLRGTKSVAADEVESNVREHIDIALASASGPVSAAEVIGVLDRLGPPERWLADEERPAWRKIWDRLRSGPEDWRLAYVSFGLFLMSILFIPFMIPAFVVSRAYVEFSRKRGEELGARRWLVYPAIAFMLALSVVMLVIGPALPLLIWGIEDRGFHRIFDVPRSIAGELRFHFGMGGVLFGSWWIVASMFVAAFLRPIRFVFMPLLDHVQRKHIAVLTLIGAVVAGAGGALIYYR
jgi:hypothetical protein